MKQLNNIDFIESLAEGTRHFDQESIKQSLLKTLDQFSDQSNYELYRISINTSETTLSLIAIEKNHKIETYRNGKKTPHSLDYLLPHIIIAIDSHKVITVSCQNFDDKFHYIYPYYNKENDIFTVLIQDCSGINLENQRLVLNLFILYSNYLNLIEKVKRDKLTNLLNRETLDTEITRILSDTQNNELVLSKKYNDIVEQRDNNSQYKYWLGVLDIDLFKNINDNFGHLYGDEVLILVAQLIEKTVRSYDLVFRYGGEEFVVLIQAPDRKVAFMAFDRIRKEIEKYHFAKVKQLTISIGFTVVCHQNGTSEIIGNADKALYFAKKHGRNQSLCYEDLVDEKQIVSSEQKENDSDDINFF